MASAVTRGIVCPKNLSPTCLTVTVGDRGTEDSGRLMIGLIVAPNKGILQGDEGLEIDACYVQQHQFGKKSSRVFSAGKIYTAGISS